MFFKQFFENGRSDRIDRPQFEALVDVCGPANGFEPATRLIAEDGPGEGSTFARDCATDVSDSNLILFEFGPSVRARSGTPVAATGVAREFMATQPRGHTNLKHHGIDSATTSSGYAGQDLKIEKKRALLKKNVMTQLAQVEVFIIISHQRN